MHFVPPGEGQRFAFERFFYEKICRVKVGQAQNTSIALPAVGEFSGLRYSCVQDTVERLIGEEGSGSLSTFQWRNIVFAYIGQGVNPTYLKESIIDALKKHIPALFVRSYVYLVFIKVSGDTLPGLVRFDERQRPSANDFRIYYWNTNYELDNGRSKNDLFGLGGGAGKVFLVNNLEAELARIKDANSDVIDAVRAYLGDLDLFGQTKTFFKEICDCFDSACSGGAASSDVGILVRGPARSGKTVLAMSLLHRYPSSQLLLMNWYFWDALKDAFTIFASMSKEDIAKLFEVPTSMQSIEIELERCEQDRDFYQTDFLLRSKRKEECGHFPVWAKKEGGWVGVAKHQEWLDKGRFEKHGYIPVFAKTCKGESRQNVSLNRIDEQWKRGESYQFSECHIIRRFLDDKGEEENEKILTCLREMRTPIEGRTEQLKRTAELLQEIGYNLNEDKMRFCHHDLSRKRREGCWREPNQEHVFAGNRRLTICDEAQRLGIGPDGVDEVKGLLECSPLLFLCGDDNQMLNPDYDKGIQELKSKLPAGKRLKLISLPESIGIPGEVERLIKYLLGIDDSNCPHMADCGYTVRLIYNSDATLVREFEKDGATRKHYAIPNNRGFYKYSPYILKSTTKTPDCTNKCNDSCVHRRVSMIPEPLRSRYKYFCAEPVMPNYALSAYELISREVESVYLKIPKELGGVDMITDSEGIVDGIANKWRKNHLYILMTRATMKLAINIEDKGLFDYFVERCEQAGMKGFVL